MFLFHCHSPWFWFIILTLVFISSFNTSILLWQSARCSDENCSYNGKCINMKGDNISCKCDIGWKGKYCHQLRLGKCKNFTGLNELHREINRTSTWGGSVLKGEDELWHMWASEISRHCGIHRWLTNSVVVHAVSNNLSSPFQRKEVVFPLFSHEPIVTRAPTGEYVMYFSSFPGASASDQPICNCSDGNSISGEPGCHIEPGVGVNKTLYSYMSYSKTANGPWSQPQSLAHVTGTNLAHVDLNLAPVIRADGSAEFWTRWNIWQADDWKNVSTYRDTGQAPDFLHDGIWEGEDPSLWIDQNGHYHIISHNGERGKTGTRGDCGRHMFSESGLAGTWRVPHTLKDDLGGCAYPRTNIPFEDGSIRSFYRRERPHLIFDNNIPVALSTAVVDSPSLTDRDASYSLIQLVAVHGHETMDIVTHLKSASDNFPETLFSLFS
mmetsp:Transcript_20302/g.24631  ORF Transcript_20302/g.24631 Transcript_20302/m.24631 type:complete len:438 (+) Transcript_20302:174-1487(+)